MHTTLADHIQGSMQKKSTEELVELLFEGNSDMWSEEAFASARVILHQRGVSAADRQPILTRLQNERSAEQSAALARAQQQQAEEKRRIDKEIQLATAVKNAVNPLHLIRRAARPLNNPYAKQALAIATGIFVGFAALGILRWVYHYLLP